MWHKADLLGADPYPGETLEKQEAQDIPPFVCPECGGHERHESWCSKSRYAFWYRIAGENVEIAEVPFKESSRINVVDSVAYVHQIHPGLVDWAEDFGFHLAEYPGVTHLWTPGYWGKGLVGANGDLHTWPIDEKTQSPYHLQFALENQLQDDEGDESQWHSPIEIAPSGRYTNSRGLNEGEDPDGSEEEFARQIPDL